MCWQLTAFIVFCILLLWYVMKGIQKQKLILILFLFPFFINADETLNIKYFDSGLAKYIDGILHYSTKHERWFFKTPLHKKEELNIKFTHLKINLLYMCDDIVSMYVPYLDIYIDADICCSNDERP